MYKFYSKNKLNSLYGKFITFYINKNGYGKSYHEELKAKRNNTKLIRKHELKDINETLGKAN